VYPGCILLLPLVLLALPFATAAVVTQLCVQQSRATVVVIMLPAVKQTANNVDEQEPPRRRRSDSAVAAGQRQLRCQAGHKHVHRKKIFTFKEIIIFN